MISIHRQMNELGRLEALGAEALACYREAMQHAAEYAVELDPARVQALRDQVRELAAALEGAGPEQLAASRPRFRRALADYRDQAQPRVDRLRREVAEAAEALRSMGAQLTESSGAVAGGIDHQIRTLRHLTAIDNLPAVRSGLERAVTGLEQQVRELRAENERIVAQMRDEVRTLQRQIEQVQRPAAGDSGAGLAGRRDGEAALAGALAQPGGFAAGLVYLRNWKRLKLDHHERQQHEILAAVGQRIRNALGADTLLVRWADDELLALYRLDPAKAAQLSRGLAERLTQPVDLGGACVATLQASWGMVEAREHEPLAALLDRIAHLEHSITR